MNNDKLRLDSHLNCTSCSVGFPNYKLLYKFSKIDFPGTDWVVIVLDTDVLFGDENVVYFCYTNAAKLIPHIFNSRELCTVTAFENMFSERIETTDGRINYRKDLLIGDNLTTDPQAEILISEIIKCKYIKNICFQNQTTKDKFISNCDNTLFKKFSYSVYPEFFNRRKDYMFW